MSSRILYPGSLFLACLVAAASARAAPPADFANRLQTQIKDYLEARPDGKVSRAVAIEGRVANEVGVQVHLEPGQVRYVTTPGGAGKIVWSYRTDSQLTGDQRQRIRAALKGEIENVLGQRKGDLGLNDEDYKKLSADTAFEAEPAAFQRPTTPAMPPEPLAVGLSTGQWSYGTPVQPNGGNRWPSPYSPYGWPSPQWSQGWTPYPNTVVPGLPAPNAIQGDRVGKRHVIP